MGVGSMIFKKQENSRELLASHDMDRSELWFPLETEIEKQAKMNTLSIRQTEILFTQ